MNRIRVIVPVCTDIWNAPVAALMERYREPDTQLNIANLDAGPESLEFAYDKAHADDRAAEAGAVKMESITTLKEE